MALSHGAEPLILDEATSGLDPIVRDEVLDLPLDFVQDERHGVLVSSHITSDLEKVADYITFLHQGKLVFTLEKDLLVDQYGFSTAAQRCLTPWTPRTSWLGAGRRINTKCWCGTATRRRRSIPRPWSPPQPLRTPCCFM